MKNFKNPTIIFSLVCTGLLFLGFQNCAPNATKFTKIGSTENSSVSPNSLAFNHETSFKVNELVNSKVDILFVIDNSGSMHHVQEKIAQVFSGFIAQVSQLNWRIAITTTDTTSNDVPCNQGNLCIIEEDVTPRYYIDANTSNVTSVFMNKIKVGLDGSTTELGLTAIKSFLTHKRNDYKSFMRSDANFVTIVVTDSEETSSLTAAQFLESVKTLLPPGKKFINHSSITLPGDEACKALNEVENKFAQKYFDVTKATGGIAASICDQNYGSQFDLIADSTVGKVAQQNLDCIVTDQDGDGQSDVQIARNKSELLDPSSYQVSGNKIIFTPALEIVGDYKITYSCAQ